MSRQKKKKNEVFNIVVCWSALLFFRLFSCQNFLFIEVERRLIDGLLNLCDENNYDSFFSLCFSAQSYWTVSPLWGFLERQPHRAGLLWSGVSEHADELGMYRQPTCQLGVDQKRWTVFFLLQRSQLSTASFSYFSIALVAFHNRAKIGM